MKLVPLSSSWAYVDEPTVKEQTNYIVHLKYIRWIARQSKALSITSSLTPLITPRQLKELDPKLRLIQRTLRSIDEEVQSICEDHDYAHACIAWLPAKVYYNLYHLLSIIEYMVNGQQTSLRIGHVLCLKGFANRLGIGNLQFSCSAFNRVCDKNVLGFKSRSGEVLSEGITDDCLMSLIMKKIANDQLSDFKARRGLDCRKPKHKKTYQAEENNLKISIIDFFYSMRLRTNYRDMSFVGEVTPEQARNYFSEYVEAASNFYSCFNELKNDLIARVPAT